MKPRSPPAPNRSISTPSRPKSWRSLPVSIAPMTGWKLSSSAGPRRAAALCSITKSFLALSMTI